MCSKIRASTPTLEIDAKLFFDRLKSDWEAWNATMLEERPRPAAYGQPGNVTADHYGVVNPTTAAPPGAAVTR